MKLKSLIAILLFTCVHISKAQSPAQSTEIWLIDVSMKEGKPVASTTPQRITENDYYDNQPSFSKDGTLLWYAAMTDTTQSDIYEYNLKKKITRQVTNTPESEFQPQQIPNERFKISVVRVDEDKAQRFYSLVVDGSDPEILMPNEDSIAYYTWMNDTTVGAYMLNGSGGALQQFDMIPQQSIILMQNGGFGRCLARIPSTNNLSYVQKSSDGKYLLMEYKMDSEERMPLLEMIPGVEDYCWGPDRKVYAGNKAHLYYADASLESPKWIEIADYTKTAGTFYRMAMNPQGDKIAIVTYRGEKP